jgi:hypothetical protein
MAEGPSMARNCEPFQGAGFGTPTSCTRVSASPHLLNERPALQRIADDDLASGRNLADGFHPSQGSDMMAPFKQQRNEPRAEITGCAGHKHSPGFDGRVMDA